MFNLWTRSDAPWVDAGSHRTLAAAQKAAEKLARKVGISALEIHANDGEVWHRDAASGAWRDGPAPAATSAYRSGWELYADGRKRSVVQAGRAAGRRAGSAEESLPVFVAFSWQMPDDIWPALGDATRPVGYAATEEQARKIGARQGTVQSVGVDSRPDDGDGLGWLVSLSSRTRPAAGVETAKLHALIASAQRDAPPGASAEIARVLRAAFDAGRYERGVALDDGGREALADLIREAQELPNGVERFAAEDYARGREVEHLGAAIDAAQMEAFRLGLRTGGAGRPAGRAAAGVSSAMALVRRHAAGRR